MRKLIVAGGQLGPISRNETKASAIKRMSELMKQAAERGARLIVFPELALTTFFRVGGPIIKLNSILCLKQKCQTMMCFLYFNYLKN